jgi:hypothetical protein
MPIGLQMAKCLCAVVFDLVAYSWTDMDIL